MEYKVSLPGICKFEKLHVFITYLSNFSNVVSNMVLNTFSKVVLNGVLNVVLNMVLNMVWNMSSSGNSYRIRLNNSLASVSILAVFSRLVLDFI